MSLFSSFPAPSFLKVSSLLPCSGELDFLPLPSFSLLSDTFVTRDVLPSRVKYFPLYMCTLSNHFCCRTTQSSPEKLWFSAIHPSGHWQSSLCSGHRGTNPALSMLRAGKILSKKNALCLEISDPTLTMLSLCTLKTNVQLQNKVQRLLRLKSTFCPLTPSN